MKLYWRWLVLCAINYSVVGRFVMERHANFAKALKRLNMLVICDLRLWMILYFFFAIELFKALTNMKRYCSLQNCKYIFHFSLRHVAEHFYCCAFCLVLSTHHAWCSAYLSSKYHFGSIWAYTDRIATSQLLNPAFIDFRLSIPTIIVIIYDYYRALAFIVHRSAPSSFHTQKKDVISCS